LTRGGLEIGGGSITRWMSDRVGPHGHVLTTDVDTRFFETVGLANVEVRRHDILTDRLPDATLDLAYARAVLEHLPDPDLALDRMVTTLKPGGWLMVGVPRRGALRRSSTRHGRSFSSAPVKRSVPARLSLFFRRDLCPARTAGAWVAARSVRVSQTRSVGVSGQRCGGSEPERAHRGPCRSVPPPWPRWPRLVSRNASHVNIPSEHTRCWEGPWPIMHVRSC